MANPLLEQIDELFKVAIYNEKRGLYFLATMRYSQAWAMMFSLVTLRESGFIKLAPREEARLAAFSQLLATRLQMVVAKMSNGHKLSGREEDSPVLAARTLLKEVLEGF